jgi:hypothetical protein
MQMYNNKALLVHSQKDKELKRAIMHAAEHA